MIPLDYPIMEKSMKSSFIYPKDIEKLRDVHYEKRTYAVPVICKPIHGTRRVYVTKPTTYENYDNINEYYEHKPFVSHSDTHQYYGDRGNRKHYYCGDGETCIQCNMNYLKRPTVILTGHEDRNYTKGYRETLELSSHHGNHSNLSTCGGNSRNICRCLVSNNTPNNIAYIDEKNRKRQRTIFTSSQVKILEEKFQECNYIVGEDRTFLARQLRLTEQQIKIWFQNRRTKNKGKPGTKDEKLENQSESCVI